jgi:hypothetical protein
VISRLLEKSEFMQLWRMGVIAFASCVLLAIGPGTSDGAQRISKRTAISIAVAEARPYWYDPSALIIDADETNSAWEGFLAELQEYEPNALREPPLADLLSKLAGKTYWAVKFAPRARRMSMCLTEQPGSSSTLTRALCFRFLEIASAGRGAENRRTEEWSCPFRSIRR